MKKIMFNDRYGLTAAVLDGRKTMTRRIIPDRVVLDYNEDYDLSGIDKDSFIFDNASFKLGEEVAVAQRYIEVYNQYGDWLENRCEESYTSPKALSGCAGWSNKMYVKAGLMPHRIRITGIKVERLQDISDGDCFNEGIIPITWRQHLKQDWDDLSPQKCIDHHVYSLPKFRKGIEDAWAESDPDEYIAEDAKTAFAVLIMKMMGKKVWNDNPWVFAYSFRLIK